MLNSDPELWKAATNVIQHYGQDAGAAAWNRAYALMAVGDGAGCCAWRKIAAAIDAWYTPVRDPSTSVH